MEFFIVSARYGQTLVWAACISLLFCGLPPQNVMAQTFDPARDPDPPSQHIGPRPGFKLDGHTSSSASTHADQAIVLTLFFNVAADCKPWKIQYTVLEAPKHGVLSYGSKRLPDAYLWSGPDDPRTNCETANLSWTSVIYTPEKNFVGTDHLSVRLTDEFGGSEIDEFSIRVVAQGHYVHRPASGR
jgi:hypothetical protein